MHRRRIFGASGLLAAVVGVAVIVPAAGGASTVGPSLDGVPDKTVADCPAGTPCVYIPFSGSGLPTTFPPFNQGVITKWRVKSGAAGAGGDVTLRVFETAEGGYKTVGSSNTETITNTGETPNVYETRIPMTLRNFFGVENSSGAPLLGENTAYTTSYHVGAMPVGTEAFFAGYANFRKVFVDADIEFDADGDGYGDETQDQCPGDAAVHTQCVADLEVKVDSDYYGYLRRGVVKGAIDYSIKVTNNGTSSVSAVTLTDVFPSALKVKEVGVTSLRGTNSECAATQTVTCTSPKDDEYGSGETIQFYVTTVPKIKGTLAHTASAKSALSDPNSANDSTTHSLKIVKPGKCATLFRGTDKGDRIFGYRNTGDTIKAGGGNDEIDGDAGDDCLFGGPKNDYIEGNEGNDKLVGEDGDDSLIDEGGGDDTLIGGPGRNKYIAGKGDDTIKARNGTKDVAIDCGTGEDVAIVDKTDKTKGCEVVKAA
jgi:uncharacterized repeat protein (TIGR01451 family)